MDVLYTRAAAKEHQNISFKVTAKRTSLYTLSSRFQGIDGLHTHVVNESWLGRASTRGGVQHSVSSFDCAVHVHTCVLAAATVHVSKDATRKRALHEHCRDHVHLPRQTLKSGSLKIADSCARRGSDENALAF